MVEAATWALLGNVTDLRKEFPLATFRILDSAGRPLQRHTSSIPATIVACCPANMRTVVLGRVQQAIHAVQVKTATVDLSGLPPTTLQQLAHAQHLKQICSELKRDFKCCIKLSVNMTNCCCSITCFTVLLPVVEGAVRARLGLPQQQPAGPAPAPTTAPQQHEQRAVQALQVLLWPAPNMSLLLHALQCSFRAMLAMTA